MSDTPETDGITFFATKDMMPPYNTVPAEFARKLERERDEALAKTQVELKAERDNYASHLNQVCDELGMGDGYIAVDAAIMAAAEIKRLKESVESLRDQLCADKCRDKAAADGGWANI